MLTPAFALSGTLPINPPTYENMSVTELDAFLAEMESDIRAAERDLREISALESKGVTGAGKLGDYEALQPRLDALLEAHNEDSRLAADLEKRIALLMDHYATNVRCRLPRIILQLFASHCSSLDPHDLVPLLYCMLIPTQFTITGRHTVRTLRIVGRNDT